MTPEIPVIRSSMPPLAEYMEEIKELWDSRWLTNHGEKAASFEDTAAKALDAPYAMCFVNGHQALEVALQALDLKGEVITTPFTFVSTTAAIVRSGLTPVFCDIRPSDYTIDPDQIEALITDKTCAILGVHVYGNLCDDERIEAIAQKHHLKVIYDAAHAFGVRKDGKGAGALGDMSMFSLHATKVLNSIEGGLLCFKDESMLRTLWALQNFGITGPETVGCVGTNAKMNEFQAAMGLCNLRHLEEYIAARQKVYARYLENLADVPGIALNWPQAGVRYNYAYFPILVDPDRFGMDRNELAEKLAQNGIGTRKYFAPLTSTFDCYRPYFRRTPVAERVSAQVLTLPMYSDLTTADVDRICNLMR